MYTSYNESKITPEEWSSWQSAPETLLKEGEKYSLDEEKSVVVITRPIGIIEKIVALFELLKGSFIALFSDDEKSEALRKKAWDAYEHGVVVRQLQGVSNQFHALPEEGVIEVMSRLDIPEMKLLMQVNKQFYKLAKKNDAWRLCAEKIGCELTLHGQRPILQIKEHIFTWRGNVCNIPKEIQLYNTIPSLFNPLLTSECIEDIVTLQKQYLNFFYSCDKLSHWVSWAKAIQVTDCPYLWHITSNEVISTAEEFEPWCEKHKTALTTLIVGKIDKGVSSCWSPVFVPPEIRYLTGLTKLEVKLTGLSTSTAVFDKFPAEMAHLPNLKRLKIQAYLTEFPEHLTQLQTLETLDLNFNWLEDFPDSILAFSSLKVLSLYGNKLTSLSPNISMLTVLQELCVARNRLTELPQEICQLTELRTLQLVLPIYNGPRKLDRC